MPAYYNEIDPKAAAWLRELIRVGAIAPGDVDERSIVDVRPADLRGYRQCHFFAGIGIWSYALRLAGWEDEREVWTGSCPCQPFSAAGKGLGHEDERHLWPTWFGLIRECRPVPIFGEQVADGDGYAWLDDVGYDLESIAYAIGAVCPTACGVGAPHERQRLFFVADTGLPERRPHAAGRHDDYGQDPDRPQGSGGLAERRSVGGMVDTFSARSQGLERPGNVELHGRTGPIRPTTPASVLGGMGHAVSAGREARGAFAVGSESRSTEPAHSGAYGGLADANGRGEGDRGLQRSGKHGLVSQDGGVVDADRRPGPVNGFWGTADWLRCRDEWWRPVESGTFPLADGAAARLVRLRGYGNGINAEVARAFIEAYLDVTA